jgi:hypothetical protein
MTFRTILAGLTGFPPPIRPPRYVPEPEDLNTGRRWFRDPERKEKCYRCNHYDATIFLRTRGTSQLPPTNRGYCEIQCIKGELE